MVWSTIVVFAAALAAISGEDVLTFPEVARELSSSRIVSGWEAETGQLPFQSSLRMVSSVGGVSSCGATLIHEAWGLTAAHCTAGRISFVHRLGGVNLTTPYYIFETTRYYNHPDYNNNLPSVVQPHDIGLLDLERKLIFNDLVQPIRLQRSGNKDRNVEGETLVASGWGRTWTNGASPENLNWVYLTGVTNQQCSNSFGGSSIIVASTICARGYNVSSQSTCQGDSGGPLVSVDDDGQLSQVGVTSFVSGWGCHAGLPAGFIRPGYYHEWITNVTKINFDWELNDSTETPDNGTTTEPPELPTNATTTSAPGNETTTEIDLPTTSAPGNETTTDQTEAPELSTTSTPDVTTVAPEGTTQGPEEEEDCEEGLEYFGGPVNIVDY